MFSIAGGASLHLIHSVAQHKGLKNICPHHEQAAAMAADAYARVSRNLGAAIATSGPGATNLVTGICCAYYDSVPVIFISGQVATFRLKQSSALRQRGFQETEIVKMVQTITKYAVLVTDKSRIRYELEKATHLARSGRPGPVLVDIPDDLQRQDIDPNELEGFEAPPVEMNQEDWMARLDECVSLIEQAVRPVLVIGWGIRLAKAEQSFLSLADKLKVPILPTWGCVDLLPASNPLLVGTFGTHGTRHGNFAVQNADLVLAIGTRLDTHSTGNPPSSFARGAKKIIVDIDCAELRKFDLSEMKVDLPLCADAGQFVEALLEKVRPNDNSRHADWFKRIGDWKSGHPIVQKRYWEEKAINPYVFIETLSRHSEDGDIFFIDTGCVLPWMMQTFTVKRNQRIFHAFNNTPMGYALPASMGGAAYASDRRIICLVGDGGLQINIQELASVAYHKPHLKIFVFDNRGYSMIRQTQDQWLDSNYIASSPEGGLAMPDFTAVAEGYGIPALTVSRASELEAMFKSFLAADGPGFCTLKISEAHRVIPQVKFGRPIEDAEPLLDREEFLASMIVEPMDVSKKPLS